MISATVMAHPRRAGWVPGLLSALDDPRVTVTWDEGWNDRHLTGLAALRSFDPGASHHLVIQDDALVCRDLIAGLELVVAMSGEHPLCLYTGHVGERAEGFKAARRRLGEKAGFMAGQGPWWGVGIVVPTAHLPELCDWFEAHREIPNYDRRISRWYLRETIDCWYTVPSLVDHRSGDENPSLVAGRSGTSRRALEFVGDRSALELEWDPVPLTDRALLRTVSREGLNKSVVVVNETDERIVVNGRVFEPGVPVPMWVSKTRLKEFSALRGLRVRSAS